MQLGVRSYIDTVRDLCISNIGNAQIYAFPILGMSRSSHFQYWKCKDLRISNIGNVQIFAFPTVEMQRNARNAQTTFMYLYIVHKCIYVYMHHLCTWTVTTCCGHTPRRVLCIRTARRGGVHTTTTHNMHIYTHLPTPALYPHLSVIPVVVTRVPMYHCLTRAGVHRVTCMYARIVRAHPAYVCLSC